MISACNAARDRTSPTIAHQIIGRDRSLERLSADSQETVSQFELPLGTRIGARHHVIS
jgi:hypothetical protein